MVALELFCTRALPSAETEDARARREGSVKRIVQVRSSVSRVVIEELDWVPSELTEMLRLAGDLTDCVRYTLLIPSQLTRPGCASLTTVRDHKSCQEHRSTNATTRKGCDALVRRHVTPHL